MMLKMPLAEARAKANLLQTQMFQKGCSCSSSQFQAISDELTELLAYIQYKENLFKKLEKEANQPLP